MTAMHAKMTPQEEGGSRSFAGGGGVGGEWDMMPPILKDSTVRTIVLLLDVLHTTILQERTS